MNMGRSYRLITSGSLRVKSDVCICTDFALRKMQEEIDAAVEHEHQIETGLFCTVIFLKTKMLGFLFSILVISSSKT